MTRQQLEQAFRQLVQAHASRSGNERCIECAQCERCVECTFCRRSVDLVRCHYCIEVHHAMDCTHCQRGRDLIRCTHCQDSARCTGSAYLEHCLDCSDCNYCFACVGLNKREFHVLNEPYSRSDYFKLTAQLQRELAQAQLLPR